MKQIFPQKTCIWNTTVNSVEFSWRIWNEISIIYICGWVFFTQQTLGSGRNTVFFALFFALFRQFLLKKWYWKWIFCYICFFFILFCTLQIFYKINFKTKLSILIIKFLAFQNCRIFPNWTNTCLFQRNTYRNYITSLYQSSKRNIWNQMSSCKINFQTKFKPKKLDFDE